MRSILHHENFFKVKSSLFFCLVQTFTFSFWSSFSPPCRWWCFPFCSVKLKKAKRRLTVDPFDFKPSCDYLIETRRWSNQVKSVQPQNQLWLICLVSYKRPSVCFSFSLFLFPLFAKHCLLWQDNSTFVLSTVIIHSNLATISSCTSRFACLCAQTLTCFVSSLQKTLQQDTVLPNDKKRLKWPETTGWHWHWLFYSGVTKNLQSCYI